MNPYKDMEESSFLAAPHLSYEDIASKLLKDHFFLTALELHTELVESGKELPQLREFFSNPGNFEQHVSRPAEFIAMQRTPSIATLDSLDTTRYSEDGGGDRGGSGGDVAVLEFELRKARETINSLRANLTQFADGESVLDKNKSPLDQKDLKPHERKALNFLINEYLLLQDYKLTSITFSDENPDQDFEDWDDVGLNMPRPSSLVSLFRGKSTIEKVTNDNTTQTDLGTVHMECQTDIDDSVCHVSDHDWTHELLIQAEEIDLLKQKIIALETEKVDFQKLYDAAIVSLNSLTTPVLETKGLELIIPEDKLANQVKSEFGNSQPLPCNAAENHYGSGNSTHSATPELFEMIDNDKSSVITKKESNTSSFDQNSARESPQKLGSVTTLDETLSINDGGEWTRVQYDYNNVDCESNKNKHIWIESNIPNRLKSTLMSWCSETSTNEQISNDLLAELINGDKPLSMSQLLNLVADTLLRIIPHTLVSRRCEAAALIASTVHLLGAQDGGQRRGKSLQLLLTLLKRPDAAEARVICEATSLIVKWGNSGDVLSSIAELLTSRSTERRVLASQICLSIAPYVSIDLCTSLLLSLVILMCESSENEVRSLGLKSACLISAVAEHKYSQLENILFTFIKDPVEKNVHDAVNMFCPVLARAALVAGKLSTDLCARVLTNCTKYSQEKDWKNMLLYLEMFKKLVLAQLAFVSTAQTVRDYAMSSCDIESINLQEVCLDNYQKSLDIQCYMMDDVSAKSLILAMNSLVKEQPDIRWGELDWMLDLMKQLLDNAVENKVLNQPSVYTSLINLFNSYIDNFGLNFTCIFMKCIFSNIIAELENKLEKLHTVHVESTVVVGIYLVTVLPALDNTEELDQFFHKWIMYSSIRGLPVKLFVVPMKWLADNKPTLLDKYLQSLREFSASSCESASGVSIRVFIGNLIAEFLNNTVVSESCVESQLLPAVVALLHDEDVSVRESGISSWGSLTRLSARHRLAVLDKCWSVLDLSKDDPGSLSTREINRLAEELALLIMPGGDRDAPLLDKAVSMVCKVCASEALGECLSSLTPGLQLAAHHAPRHPLLLPALRNLEELIQAPHLSQHKPTIEALIHNVTGPSAPAHPPHPRHAPEPNPRELNRTGPNLNAAEMGRRVTQMFQQSKTNMNLPNIFKKKT